METIVINGETFTIPVEVKDTIDGLFNVHETFMVRLCEVLKLDYLETTEDEIILVIEKLRKFYEIEQNKGIDIE